MLRIIFWFEFFCKSWRLQATVFFIFVSLEMLTTTTGRVYISPSNMLSLILSLLPHICIILNENVWLSLLYSVLRLNGNANRTLRGCQPLRRSQIRLPKTALASFPGSGNTWARHILQQATGRRPLHIKLSNKVSNLSLKAYLMRKTPHFGWSYTFGYKIVW